MTHVHKRRVLADATFRGRHHVFQSFVRELRLVLLSCVFEANWRLCSFSSGLILQTTRHFGLGNSVWNIVRRGLTHDGYSTIGSVLFWGHRGFTLLLLLYKLCEKFTLLELGNAGNVTGASL